MSLSNEALRGNFACFCVVHTRSDQLSNMEIGLRLEPNPLIERRDRPAVISRSTLSLIISLASLYVRHPYYKTPSGAQVNLKMDFKGVLKLYYLDVID